MNKQISPLEALERIGNICEIRDTNYYKIIETALKDYEGFVDDLELKNRKIEELTKDNARLEFEYIQLQKVATDLKKELELTTKKLKALEIIKEKQWFDDFMKEHLTREWFTKDELVLLKEVLL